MAWTAVTLPLVLAFLGLVLDAGFVLLQSQRLDSATDAAALAAAAVWDRDEWLWRGRVVIDAGQAQRQAGRYLRKNLPDARLAAVRVNTGSAGTQVVVRTRLEVRLFFMRFAGKETVTVRSTSEVTRKHAR